MRVLLACEESQTVCKEFRKLGHEAYSCDILPCSGGHPEWHIQDDVRKVLYRQEWNLVIAHPPCTRLANSGVRWLAERNLWSEMLDACHFFNLFQAYGVCGNAICIENPIPHKYAIEHLGKYHQLIQPWMFGHGETKATCLWLYNLPPLIASNIVTGREGRVWKTPPSPDRARIRSKTYPGIAAAMAEQWGREAGLTGNILLKPTKCTRTGAKMEQQPQNVPEWDTIRNSQTNPAFPNLCKSKPQP